jgi:hypothetical protein
VSNKSFFSTHKRKETSIHTICKKVFLRFTLGEERKRTTGRYRKRNKKR